MKIDQLSYFLATARKEHVGQAAKSLFLTPSAISHAIAALEKELGCKLFDRERQRLTLTSHGKKLAELIEPLLSELERIKCKVASPHAELTGYYRVGGTHGFACELVAGAWGRLLQEHPRLSGECLTLRSGEILERIRNHELDVALCYAPVANSDFERVVLRQEPLWICVRRDHPIFNHDRADRFTQLSAFPCAAPKAYSGIENCDVHPLFSKIGLRPDIRFAFDNYESACAFLTASDFWTLLPEFVLTKDKGALRKVDPEQHHAAMDIALVWSTRRVLPRALQLLIEYLRSVLEGSKLGLLTP